MKTSCIQPALLATLLVTACTGPREESAESTPPFDFREVGEASGLTTVMACGGENLRQILETNGGGLGLIDYDKDMDLDLFIANGATLEDPTAGPGSSLWNNDGHGRFSRVTQQAGIHLDHWAMGVTVGDVDGNGWDDLYVTCWGPNVLLLNRGDGTFMDATEQAGVGDERWGTGAVLGDFDADGDLDLYCVNYLAFDPGAPPPRVRHKTVEVMGGPHGLPPQDDVYYENTGGGIFRDRTLASGCGSAQPSYGLNAIAADLDNDGHTDIYVGNDSMANYLFRGHGDGTFEEIGQQTGAASNIDGSGQATMGIALADVNGNGYPDLLSTNFANDTNTLHLNTGRSFFDDHTRQWGLGIISRPFLGWSCGFFDFDHDGDEDLLLFNGHVYPEASMDAMDSNYRQPPLLFERREERFHRVDPDATSSWLSQEHVDRTAVFGDLDGDADIDVIIGERWGPVRMLRNENPPGAARPVLIALEDTGRGNHRGIGSRIVIRACRQTWTRWIVSGGGFQSSSAHHAHLALPAGCTTMTVDITWPGGETQHLEDLQLGEELLVRIPRQVRE